MAFTLEWDKTGQKLAETGVDRTVLYVIDSDGSYGDGESWNGMTAINETPSGAEATKLYADNGVYITLYSAEEYGYGIEAYMYPDGFKKCLGEVEAAPGVVIKQQQRSAYGLAYRTLIANDTQGTSYGYKIHIVYNSKVSPSEVNHQTINDSPEAGTFSWEATSTPVSVADHDPTCVIEIDSTKVDAAKLKEIETKLYGDGTTKAKILMPDEVFEILNAA